MLCSFMEGGTSSVCELKEEGYGLERRAEVEAWPDWAAVSCGPSGYSHVCRLAENPVC